MAKTQDRLASYNAKRDFSRSDEPEGRLTPGTGTGPIFIVQKHDARRTHYDFRLEWDGALLSWAVTKGPSDDPSQKRLAVRTEDHPLDYADFEGTIPKGEYGGGTVMLWDRGSWEPRGNVGEGLKKGKLKFELSGARMKGGWTLVRMRNGEKRENWLLIKERDDHANDDPDALVQSELSVTTGRTMEAISKGERAKNPPKSTPQRTGTRPKFRKPQLATLVDAAPEGDDWIHETKFDGYRCLAALGKGGAKLFTRSGNDWTDRFAALDGAFDALPCDSAMLDGEIMAATIRGSPFSSLQSALGDGDPLVYFAFDLLELDGDDLTGLPLSDRRDKLRRLLSGAPAAGPLRISEDIRGNGAEVFQGACESGAEGIISKRADAPYRGRRNLDWRKVKCTKRQEFVIGGYSPSDKNRPFASLLMGTREGSKLRYRGRVGTGFSERDFEQMEKAMSPRKTSPFVDVPRDVARNASWLRPDLIAEVDFTELTTAGHIRHGSFLGLRDDKAADEVKMENPETETRIAGVRLSNPDRAVFPDAGCTKRDVACHYDRVGERMTAIVAHRPLSLLRCPDGISGDCFFQKHAGKGFPEALQRVDVVEKDGATAEYLYVTRPEALVAAAQMGTIEFHIWGARKDRLDRPDRLVFDLDPADDVAWGDVRQAALDLRHSLADLGLASVPVVTGGKGVHVCVVLRRAKGWDTVKGFTKTLAHIMAAREPDRFVATMSKARRKGRIYIDWLRNERGATAIAPYSLRARPGAPVAVPVTWDELAGLKAPNEFSMAETRERLEDPCPYLDALDDPQSLNESTVEKLEKWSKVT